MKRDERGELTAEAIDPVVAGCGTHADIAGLAVR